MFSRIRTGPGHPCEAKDGVAAPWLESVERIVAWSAAMTIGAGDNDPAVHELNGIPTEGAKQWRLLDLTLQNKEFRHGSRNRLADRIKHRANWIVQADADSMRRGQPQDSHSIQQAGVSQVGQEHVVVTGFDELAGFDKRRQILCAG